MAAPAPATVRPAGADSLRGAGARRRVRLSWVVLAVLGLSVASLFVGVSDVSPVSVLAALVGPGVGQPGDPATTDAAMVLLESRVPRTLAILLAGAAMAVAGLIMQLLTRNRFVEPSTAGTVEWALLGLLVVTLVSPGASLLVKMLVAAAFALAGTVLFLRILRTVPLRSVLLVPLVGLMLGGIVGAVATFVAYRVDLLQSLAAWTTGDFSGVVRGRYELLWVALALTVVAYLAADRFTVAGMGEDFATNLGLDSRRVRALGITIVSLVSATVVVTVGVIPFLGLVVPNVVSLLVGDNMRRTAPWVAVLGAGFVLVCDLIGRVVRYPYEVPVGVVVGVLGSVIFLHLLLSRDARVA